MASIAREVLTVNGQSLPLYVAGLTKAAFSTTGTWTGTIFFEGSNDGLNFVAISVKAFPPSTAASVQSATANGNWEFDVKNFLVVRVRFALTTGSVGVVIAAAVDSSWQDAYLVPTSKYVSQSVASGAANAITQAAQANRAWRLRSCQVGFSVASAAGVDIKVTDGASSTLWEGYVPLNPSGNAASSGGTFQVPLPPPDVNGVTGAPTGGVVGTPGNSMVVTLAAPGGSVTSTLNCEFVAA